MYMYTYIYIYIINIYCYSFAKIRLFKVNYNTLNVQAKSQLLF